jgi:hypothetical protein
MCDNCQEKMIIENPDEEYENLDMLDSLEGTYENSFLPPLIIPVEQYDNEDFYRGFKAYQEIAGAIVALTNVGIHPSEALGFITNRETMVHNLEVGKINKEMNIEVSKNTLINAEKNSL